MIRLLAAAVLVGGLFGTARAQDEEPKAKKLSVGDPAPPVKADKWLQGKEVTAFEPGKVYIVEFWATWCGPCIVMMPHMAELQADYRDKGVTFIGHTSKDRNGNDEPKVTEFVKKRGPKLGYTFAYQENRETNDAYMKAAGQNGIPCCFVVDKGGKVAYIGHPIYLDVVLPKVTAAGWDSANAKAEADKVEEVFNAAGQAGQNKDAEAGLAKLAELEKANPGLENSPIVTGAKMGLLARAKKFDDLQALAEKLLAKAEKYEDTRSIGGIAAALTAPAVKDQKGLTALAAKAADALLKAAGDQNLSALMTAAKAHRAAGDEAKAKGYTTKAVGLAEEAVKKNEKNLNALVTAAQVCADAGEKAKAKEYAEKAVAAAPNENVKKQVERILKPILDEKKDNG